VIAKAEAVLQIDASQSTLALPASHIRAAVQALIDVSFLPRSHTPRPSSHSACVAELLGWKAWLAPDWLCR
jgi:hypothetical protein